MVETMKNRPDSSGRSDLDVRHFENALHLRPLAYSGPFLYDGVFYLSLLIFFNLFQPL